MTPVDYLLRRTNYMLFMREQMDTVLPDILLEMAAYYQWTDEEAARQKDQLEQALAKNDLAYLKG